MLLGGGLSSLSAFLVYICFLFFFFFTGPRGDSQLYGPSGLHINLPSSRDSDTEAAAIPTVPATTPAAAAASGKRIYLSFLVFNYHITFTILVTLRYSPQHHRGGGGKKAYLFTYFFKYIQFSFHAP